ncbi:tetratricopeptide repeat protein [bacterium]|nr:tetratricopeptide repeat protein [bacterium]
MNPYIRFPAVAAALVAAVFVSACAARGRPVTGELRAQAAEIEAGKKIDDKSNLYYLAIVAENARISGDIEGARQALDAMARIEDNADIERLLARIAVQTGDLDQALKYGRRAYELAPGDVENAALLAGIHSVMGNIDDAIEVYEQTLKRLPDEPEIPILLARLYMLKKDERKAHRLLTEHVRRHPESAEGHFELARMALAENDCATAVPHAKKSIEAEPRFARAYIALGLCAELVGEDEEAIAAYERALELEPDNSNVRSHLVRMHLRDQRLDEAERENEKLRLFQYEDEVGVQITRGLILYQRGRFEEASEEFKLILSAEPQNGEARYLLGMSRMRLSDLHGALETLARIPQDHDRYYDGIRVRAHILRRLRRPAEAAQVLRQALQMNPEDAATMSELAFVLADMGEVDRAIELMNEAVKIAPDRGRMMYSYANLLERVGRWREGVELMETVLEQDPDDADAMNYIGYTLVEHDTDIERAEILLRRAIEMRPNDGPIIDSYGWLLYKQGKYQEAQTWLARAHELLPDEPVIAEHLGDCYVALNLPDKAREVYREALERNPEPDQQRRLEQKLQGLE